ncbi:pyridoxamine 5'-phosphate oxidase family protein [Salana multivorans]
MPLTNPWLAGPTPEGVLGRPLLEERILNLLSTHDVAVIATVNADGSPVATPVRYYSLGFEIFYTSWNSSVKSRNLERDPRVSAGIVAPLVGQASSRGAQIFGTARTLERADPDADRYWEAFRWQSDHAERGRPLDSGSPTKPLVLSLSRTGVPSCPGRSASHLAAGSSGWETHVSHYRASQASRADSSAALAWA